MVCVIALSDAFVEDMGWSRPCAEQTLRTRKLLCRQETHAGIDLCLSALLRNVQRNPGVWVLLEVINPTQNFRSTPFPSVNERSSFPESLLALAPKHPLTTFANLMAVK